MQLSQHAITTAAFDLLQEYGLADVSMRRIATALGVAPGALYWHIENKQALIAALAEAITHPLLHGEERASDALELSKRFRQAVLAVRDGAEVVITALGYPDSTLITALREMFVQAIQTDTLASATVAAAAEAIVFLTLGSAMAEQARRQLSEATGGATSTNTTATAQSHELAIQLLLDGLSTTAQR